MKLMKTVSWTFLGGALLLALALPAFAEADGTHSFNFYVQQAWPKQTQTNDQIQQINQTFGTDFDDWSDVPNLSIGAQLLWRVSPYWKVGMQVDYGAGSIEGSAQVPTEAGPAKLSFEQRYDVYADLYAVAQVFPWPEWKKVLPFLYGGIGVAYESDTTTLKLQNSLIDEGLRVENDGWFPTYTAGFGIDVPFSAQSPWHCEIGVAYVWARMTNQVHARGSLAPAPTVTADTDLTGPNYWLGIGRSF
jgi:hypothetical protein